MAEAANVNSVDAIERFRAALLVYLEKARIAVDDVSDDVHKTRFWLEGEQTRHWQQEVRSRTKKLEAARQELFTARLSGFTEDTQFQQMAVNRAERALEEAEKKLKTIRKWLREFDSVVMPSAKQLEKIDAILTTRMPKGAHYLGEVIKALDAYAHTQAPSRPVIAESGGEPETEPEPSGEQ